MPCYTINLVTIELKQENIDLILQTLEEMNLNPIYSKKYQDISTTIGSFDLKNKKVIINEKYQKTLNNFKVNYSKNALRLAAKKNRWVLRDKQNNKYVAVKY